MQHKNKPLGWACISPPPRPVVLCHGCPGPLPSVYHMCVFIASCSTMIFPPLGRPPLLPSAPCSLLLIGSSPHHTTRNERRGSWELIATLSSVLEMPHCTATFNVQFCFLHGAVTSKRVGLCLFCSALWSRDADDLYHSYSLDAISSARPWAP